MLTIKRETRKKRIRSKISGTADIPRLSVYRSNKYIYVQLINDEKHKTLAAAKGTDTKSVAEEISKVIKKQKIEKIVFDRGGYRYHGKIKLLADTLREGGLEF